MEPFKMGYQSNPS